MENTVSLCSFELGLGDDGRMFSRLVRIPSIHDLAYPDVGRYADNGGDNDVLYEFNGGVGGQEVVWLGWGGAKKDRSEALIVTISAVYSTIWKDGGNVGDWIDCDLVNEDESLDDA